MAKINKDELKIGVTFTPCRECDKVEVVRCKDCKHYRPESQNGKVKYCCRSAFVKVGELDFCSYGERKDDE